MPNIYIYGFFLLILPWYTHGSMAGFMILKKHIESYDRCKNSESRVLSAEEWGAPRPKTLDERAWEGLESGSASSVCSAIVDGSTYINVYNYQNTPLSLAASDYESETFIPFLIDKKAHIKTKLEHNGSTALHYAAVYNNPIGIELLIKAQADIDAEDCHYFTPLHLAAIKENSAAVRTLIRAGAQIGLKNINFSEWHNAQDSIIEGLALEEESHRALEIEDDIRLIRAMLTKELSASQIDKETNVALDIRD